MSIIAVMISAPGYDEQQLLQLVSEGREDAFRELFHAYRNKLFTYIFNIADSREMAEDTVHDVFLKIWENRATLPQIENLNAYLYRMAHNQAYSAFRRMAKETLILKELQDEQGGVDTYEEEDRIVHKEVKDYIHRAVNKLPQQQKTVFLLSRNGGLKHEEIARQLNISIYTVKNHMAEALRSLRADLSRNYGSRAIALFVFYNLVSG